MGNKVDTSEPRLGVGRADVASSLARKVYFRPQVFWQPLLPEHVLEQGLEMRMDFDSGVNFARVAGAPDEMPKSFQVEKTKVVPDAESKGDGAEIKRLLRDAATWNDGERAGHILRSCFVTASDAGPALHEAASRGHLEVLRVLVSGGAEVAAEVDGTTALHRACEQGNEEAFRLLLAGLKHPGDAMHILDRQGGTCFDAARAQDLGPLARRLERQMSNYSTLSP